MSGDDNKVDERCGIDNEIVFQKAQLTAYRDRYNPQLTKGKQQPTPSLLVCSMP
jgi:hypothetical protein